MKDKEIAAATTIRIPKHNIFIKNGQCEEDNKEEDVNHHRSLSAASLSPRHATSKYDFVKVKVWLGDHADHYYVLSRFLLSRMLTVTKIPNHVAIKISLELKKLLIDNSLLDVSQSDLEANIFKLMERRGYGDEYINRYKMMTRFHHQRVPLVILVCGTACVGKSTIATQLAQRLNLPNVLQTDMVSELLRTSTDAPLASAPIWARDFSSSEELITEFCRECRIVRKGLSGDLKKAMKDGKPVIIEGIHLDPSIYLMGEENKLPSNIPEMIKATNSVSDTSGLDDVVQEANDGPSIFASHKENSVISEHVVSQGTSSDRLDNISKPRKAIDLGEAYSKIKGKRLKDAETNKKAPMVKQNPGIEPIIVSIVLKRADFDHKAILEEWISTHTYCDNSLVQDKDKLINNLKTIQDYVCSSNRQGVAVVNISATTFSQTLDWLHNYLLQCIEQGISESSTGNSWDTVENRITQKTKSSMDRCNSNPK